MLLYFREAGENLSSAGQGCQIQQEKVTAAWHPGDTQHQGQTRQGFTGGEMLHVQQSKAGTHPHAA